MTTLAHPAPPSAAAGARPFPSIDLPGGPPPQAAPALAEPAPRRVGWLAWLLAGTAVAGVLGVIGLGVGTVLLRSGHPAQPPGDWVGLPQAVSPQQPPGQPSQPAPAPPPSPGVSASAGTRPPPAPAAAAAAAVPVPTPVPSPRSAADDLRALKQSGPYAPPAPSKPAPPPATAATPPAPPVPATDPAAVRQPGDRAASETAPGTDPAGIAAAPTPDPADAPAPQALINMVAALADDIAQEHRSDADMRQQIASLLRDTDQRLSDLDRRLAAVEANPPPTLARTGSRRASAGTVPAPPPPGGRPYEIRAASPGVAVLGALDGVPAVVEIAVGDQVPGYGRVNAIAQKGNSWAVLCEHGTIQ